MLGRVDSFASIFFSARSLLTLETVAQLGLIYFLFLVGIEMDNKLIQRSGQKVVVIGAAGVVLTFGVGSVAALALRNFFLGGMKRISCLLFLGVCNSITAFPVLAQILAKTKLLNSEIGRISIAAALANNAIMWTLFTLTLGLSKFDPLSSLWITLSGFAFVIFYFVGVRPMINRVLQKIPEGQLVSNFHVCLLLSFMMLAGVLTESIGLYSVTGAFFIGFMIPNGPVKVALSEKMHDVVYGIMMPLYCVISGLKTDLTLIDAKTGQMAAMIILVSVIGTVAKIVGIFIISGMYTMTLRDGLTLGFLLNSRGLIELLILNIACLKKLVDAKSFSVMVVVSVVMTVVATPVASYLQRPLKRIVGYKRRNLQRSKPDMELRVLAPSYN
ncbi:cation/H(+) antiporter 15-like [Curcuma longa]|uniref:cation/H(+) antiporter 15-like n=1 Tax=Curcuma longa TaxID=136217 RepID=UPI003D9E333C